ncbi:hypothetical protein TCAL_02848 [Tigriopus californicus]|uniref:Apple domain-containing protein n=1 Tax=Tigriopus californicus TaxID=6832 RepID=A0A553NZ44_TIGCA|nr:hypothetical protein TCAL_02848 [Tigriopus californicus]
MRAATLLNIGAPQLITWATVLGLAQCYIVFGPTVAPNFERKEGLLASPCPDSHPWAYANGTRCCGHYHQVNDFRIILDWYDPDPLCSEEAIHCPETHPWAIANGTQCCERFHNANDFSRALDWHDPESLCYGGNSISCPTRTYCETAVEYKDPDNCPKEYSFQIRNACCKTNIRTTGGTCNGGIMGTDDDPQCCKPEYLYQPSHCQTFKKRCRSTSTNPDCHWRGIGVIGNDLGDPYTPVQEFDGTAYVGNTKVFDTHFECQFECQKVAQCEFYSFHEHTMNPDFGRGFCYLKSSKAAGTCVYEEKTSGPKYCL